jgi:hypothetical protein
MTKKQLIEALKDMSDDKIIVFSDGIGWTKLDSVQENTVTISLISSRNNVFDKS